MQLLLLKDLPSLHNEALVKSVYPALCDSLRTYADMYYKKGTSLISDKEYDDIFAQLKAYERQYPYLKTPQSPTQTVGSIQTTQRANEQEYTHKPKMYSLDNVYDKEELALWYNKTVKKLQELKLPTTCSVDEKIDGLSIKLVYDKGQLTHAVLRGDGVTGIDIIKSVKGIVPSIPKELIPRNFDPTWDDDPIIQVPEYIELKGELYIADDVLPRINTVRLEEKKPPYATARNAVAGLVNARHLEDTKFILHGIERFKTSDPLSGAFTKLSTWITRFATAFKFSTASNSRHLSSLESIIDTIDVIYKENQRKDLEYPIDGAVVKFESLEAIAALGNTRHAPRWAIAYKYPSEAQTTTLRDIFWSMGRTGTLSPVAIFDEVILGGVKVTRASLNSAARLQKLDLHKDDTIFVVRAGEVIPVITTVVKERRIKGARVYKAPALCPYCKSPTHRSENTADVKCTNPLCPAKMQAILSYVVSRGVLNITRLGTNTITELLDSKLCYDLASLLTMDPLAINKAFPNKGLGNYGGLILQSIKDAKEKWTFATTLLSLSIPLVNQNNAVRLSHSCKNYQDLLNLCVHRNKVEALIGEKAALSLCDGIRTPFVSRAIQVYQKMGY